MEMEFSQTVVLHKLNIAHRPADDRGCIVFEDSPVRTPYIVFDARRNREAGESAWAQEGSNLRFAPHVLGADVQAFESLIEHAAALATYPGVT